MTARKDGRTCAAHSKREGNKPCGNPPAPGQLVCWKHGGNTPQARRKGAERLEEEKARAAFGRLLDHAVPVDDPFGALTQVAGEVLAWKDFCAGRIEELTALGSLDDKGAEQTVALVALFERGMDRAVATLTAIAKLNIEERMARVSERQAAAVVRAIDAALDVAGVSDQDERVRARAAGARELRAVA